MSAKMQVYVIGFHLAVGVAVLVAVTVLTALGKPISAFAAGIFGAVVGLAGGGAAATATLGTALNGKTAVPPELITNQQQIIREGARLLAAQMPISEAATHRSVRETDPEFDATGGS